MENGFFVNKEPVINCEECGSSLPLKILISNNGPYIGRVCPKCGPYSRETNYYMCVEQAVDDLSIILKNGGSECTCTTEYEKASLLPIDYTEMEERALAYVLDKASKGNTQANMFLSKYRNVDKQNTTNFIPIDETHATGNISLENGWKFNNLISIEGDLGIQIAEDGRVWICIDGVALLRFTPKSTIKLYKGVTDG